MRFSSYLKLFTLAISVLVFSSLYIDKAKADYFIWEDSDTGVTFSFPDDWYMTSRRGADEISRINAPNSKTYANCVVTYREDKRFLRYPTRFESGVQKIAYSKEFWQEFMAKHDNVEYLLLKDEAGFAKGHASHVIARYTTGYPEIYEERVSLAFTGYNAGRVLIGECTASSEEFDSYKRVFYSILKTVAQPKITHELIVGDYVNFLGWYNDFYFMDKQKLKTEKY